MNCRMKTMSSAVTALPRYRQLNWHLLPVCQNKNRNASPGGDFFMRSRAATRAPLPYPDYRRRAATAPDALSVFSPVRCLSATI